MSAKIKYDNLYVAFPVYDYEVETEMFVQYETFGRVEHRLIISPKKRLIYSKIDANGVERFYDYMTSEEVKEFTHDTSFETTSSPWKSVYCTYINGIMPLPIPSLRNEMLAAHRAKQKVVGYFIPFTDYISEKLGIDASSLSPSYAHKLLRLMNIGAGRAFMLSFDSEEAKVQLEKIGYHSKTKKK
jgi:hypothetical protein